MGIIATDLGTTNMKVVAYTDKLIPLTTEHYTVEYIREGGFVEFDSLKYFSILQDLIRDCYKKSKDKLEATPIHIVITGQAESLVVTDKQGVPIRNGISWLDMRSEKECVELASVFDEKTSYGVTGQPQIIPTWPLTKILWLKYNEPSNFARAGKFLLLKDYIIFRLTGRYVGEYSIYPFSYYFDIVKKDFWKAPLDYCGVSCSQLPELVEPCSVAGLVLKDVLDEMGLPPGSDVNVGTLDHFAGMIGTGNVCEGLVSESAGTVSSIATFASVPFASASQIPIYCGPFEDSYIYLPVCESGGISLEWFKNNFMGDESFREIDEICSLRDVDRKLTFLPYLTGINAPEFDARAAGTFYGMTLAHDKYDLALAIMYGVAALLRKNIDYFKTSGIRVEKIISTGGGAKSGLWSQIKADVCNLPVVIPQNKEAPCLGAAIIASVTSGFYPDYEVAIASCVKSETVYLPNSDRWLHEEKYRLFTLLYEALIAFRD